jgi:hypothetical protein
MPIKFSAKFIFRSLFILPVIGMVYVVFLLFRPDAALSQAANALLNQPQKPIADKDNVTLALYGLQAPLNADSTSYGRALKSAFENGESLKDKESVLGVLPFSLPDEIRCWVGALDVPRSDKPDCASADRLEKILRESVHLQRYRALQKLSGVESELPARAQQIIDLQKLHTADVMLDMEQGRVEIAYQKWRDNHVFLAKMSSAGGAWLSVAINLVNEGLSLALLDDLLKAAPTLARSHHAEIIQLMSTSAMQRYDMQKIMAAEMKFLQGNTKNIFSDAGLYKPNFAAHLVRPFINENYLLNNYADYATQFLATTSKNSNVPTALNQVREQNTHVSLSSIDFLNPVNSVLGKKWIADGNKTVELFNSMQNKESLQRLNILRLQIARDGIADENIPMYLKTLPKTLLNPFDQTSAVWDSVKRELRMPDGRGRYVAAVQIL